MIKLTCHCKNVELIFEQLPKTVRDCDCPICNRLGALWADFNQDEVQITSQQKTQTYLWGDKDYEAHHCPICGCTTHYVSTNLTLSEEIGVNLRMLDRKKLEKIPIV